MLEILAGAEIEDVPPEALSAAPTPLAPPADSIVVLPEGPKVEALPALPVPPNVIGGLWDFDLPIDFGFDFDF